ncbi:hybrid sensor histidine kinase/response regulator [Dictyobacter halimunensis]
MRSPVAEPEAMNQTTTNEEEMARMQTAHILLVDDDPAQLQALSAMLSIRMRELAVQTASQPSKALELLQEQEYDAIISDILMPGMDGLELLERIRQRTPETPVLLITGHGHHDLAMRALRSGAYDYILKPIDRDDFLVALQRALQARQLQRHIQEHQRSLEQQVEQRTQELVAAHAAKDALLRLVAHELASPLTSLKGRVQLLDLYLQQPDGLEKGRHIVGGINRSLARFERLVQDLQDTHHLQAQHFDLQRSRCDLVEVCQQVLAEFREGVETAPLAEIVDEPLEGDVDRQRISQVLLNVLSNAYKYSPQGAPVVVRVWQEGEQAVIAVQDHGVGIAAEHLARLTEPFYRVPEIQVQTGSQTGLGLGLYLVRMIVEQHGGRLEVQSQQGQGSVFSIVLPLLLV